MIWRVGPNIQILYIQVEEIEMVDMEGRAEYTEFDESISLLHARQRMETRGRVVK